MKGLIKGILKRRIPLSKVERIPDHIEKDEEVYFNPNDIVTANINKEKGEARVVLRTDQYNFKDFIIVCDSKFIPIQE